MLNNEIKKGTQVKLSRNLKPNVLRHNQEDKFKQPPSLLDSKMNVGTNEDAFNELNDLFETEKIYDYPKPSNLIKYLIKTMSAHSKEFLILDFFSGSSTTAHSVFKQNFEDNGKRNFICVQIQEKFDKTDKAFKIGYKTISELGKDRIRKSGEKIKEENKDNNNIDELDTGFKVFKLDSSNIKTWDIGLEDELEQSLFDMVDNIKEDRREEDILYEILLKYGLDLTVPIEKLKISGKDVYVIGFGALVVCLDREINLDLVEEIGKLKEEYQPEIMRVVFKDTGFENDVIKTNTMQILEKYNIDDVKSL